MTESTSAAPRRVPLVSDVLDAVFLAVTVGVLLQRAWGDQFVWTNWSDRDLYRALTFWSEWPTAGAELSFGEGGRIPGGLQYLLMQPPLWFSTDPLWSFRWQTLLDAVGVAVLALSARRFWGTTAGLVAAAAYVVTPIAWDNLQNLWNPGYLPLFAALAWAGLLRLVVDRDGRWLALVIGSLAVAAQMHLSGWLLGMAMLPVVLVARPPGLRWGLGWGLVAAFVAYLPHLIDELVRGLPNTRPLLAQREVLELGSPPGDVLGTLGRMLAYFGPVPPMSTSSLWLEALTWLLPAAVAVSAVILPVWALVRGEQRSQPATRAMLAVWGVALGILAYYASDRWITFESTGDGRYLQVLAPGVALVTAGAVARVSSGLTARFGPAVGMTVVAAAAASLLAQAVLVQDRYRWTPTDDGAWVGRRLALDSLRARTGWSLGELSGRTVWGVPIDRDPPRFNLTPRKGLAYHLELAGEAFPGSLEPPCAAVLQGYPGVADPRAPTSAEQLRTWLAPAAPEVEILDQWDEGRFRIVLYEPDGPLCRTSMQQRYVLTDAEHVLFQHAREVDQGQRLDLPPPTPGVQRVAARLGRVLFGADLAEGDPPVLVLHSNHLRGRAFNSGFFHNADVRGLRVRAVSGAGRERVFPVADLAGLDGLAPPFRVPLDLEPGLWRVLLEADAVAFDERPWDALDEAEPAQVVLFPTWRVR